MRTFFDIVSQTLRTLWAHKLRSFLTMFGIAWGVGSLLLLIGLGEGFRSGNRRELDGIGKDIIFIFPGRVPAQAGSTTGLRPYFLTMSDYEAMVANGKHLRAVTPIINRGDIKAVTDYANSNGQVFGCLPHYNTVRNLPMGSGRWLTEQDNQEGRHVMVLGLEMSKLMFPGHAALGEQVLLNNVPFTVVGILASTGRDEGNEATRRAYIPLSTMRKYFPLLGENVPEDALTYINAAPISREDHDIAVDEIKKVLARQKDFDVNLDDAFQIWDTVKSEAMVGKIWDAMNMFLGSVGIVTLALGAIGIINIMLVSVAERTKEIGLRKALGATNRSIMTQFFLEGAFLTTASGGIGIAVAGGFMSLLALLPNPSGFDTPHLVPWSAALAMGSLCIAGIIAGLYPARKAALLEPVEALRKE